MTTKSPFPEWIRQGWASGKDFHFTKGLLEDLNLHTVCQSANCPNIGDCWKRRTATMMVLGNTCTRSCRYCSVAAGAPEPPDPEEPANVAEAVRRMGLKHTVITSVTRDDLPDGGAGHIAATVDAIRALNPDTTVELLVPDFQGKTAQIDAVLESDAAVFGHNIETVERLYPVIRSKRYDYRMALGVLRHAARHPSPAIVKSAMMVGHGESAGEVKATLNDLLDAGCEAVAIGQYLQPTPKQRRVESFVHPETFKTYQQMAYDMGFAFAVAGPFVRSSYRSEELMQARFARERATMRRAAL